ncbi:MAG: enoyl-CoA hydratase/isomerase family protein [Burkholderiales bacterium]
MSKDTETLRESTLTVRDGVAEFSHQRPAARNALSDGLRADYTEMLDKIECDRQIRVLIITGSGGSFCAGGDVKAMQARIAGANQYEGSPYAMRRRVLSAHHGWLDRLRSLEMPVIAAVDGAAYGAGFSLALTADFVLASTRAKFCFAFAKVGAVADFGAFYTVPRLVGLAKAKDLMMTARRVEAAEALQLGLVHGVHEPDALLPEAHRMARRFLTGPHEALGMIKSTLNRSFDLDYRSMAELETSQQAIAMASAYHADAVARFSRGEPLAYDWDRDQGQDR